MTDDTRRASNPPRAGPTERDEFEITGCRLTREAIESFDGGERGFWMVFYQRDGPEYMAVGVCVREGSTFDHAPAKVLIFRDSSGFVPKFIYASPSVAQEFVKEFGGEVVAPSSDGQPRDSRSQSSSPPP